MGLLQAEVTKRLHRLFLAITYHIGIIISAKYTHVYTSITSTENDLFAYILAIHYHLHAIHT